MRENIKLDDNWEFELNAVGKGRKKRKSLIRHHGHPGSGFYDEC